jgi:hypothetical protein
MLPEMAEQGTRKLRLDGEELLENQAYRVDGYHACVDEIGCGASDAMRTLAFGLVAS